MLHIFCFFPNRHLISEVAWPLSPNFATSSTMTQIYKIL